MERFHYDEKELILMEKSAVPLAVYQYLDKRVVTIVLSAGFLDMFGFDDREEAVHLMDNNMYRDCHPDDMARLGDAAIRFATEGGEYNVIYRSRINGEYRIIHAFGKHIYPAEDIRLAVIWYVDEGRYSGSDIIKDDALAQSYSISLNEADLRQRSDYDYLTGVPNMTYFFELVKAKRGNAREEGREYVTGFTDFNGMKYFNKKHGFAEGDKLLRRFADLLSGLFGKENICRVGQDNFAFLALADGIEDILEKIFIEVEQISGGKSISVRIGLCPDSVGAADVSLACDRARVACNSIREFNRSGYKYFDDTMMAYENNRQYVLDNLDRALEEGWIRPYYQPIIRAANGKVCDEEALARWIDPEKGMLSPADFIPVLEDSKQIYRVDLYIVDRIIERMKQQKDDGLYVVPISVNLSRTDFDQCDVVEEIVTRMDRSGFSREMLTIEITESVIGSDFDFMKEQVERFQNLGFQVWMDDFGSGYSSLDLLQTFKFDLIKLDMRFMKQFDNGERSRIIVTELIKMAVGLGIDTVTEGVEREDQVEFLREVGCTKLQGYYFCKPVPYEVVLKRNRNGTQIGFENPRETEYYEALGRVNLYDMSVAGKDDSDKLGQYFDTLPMAIMETDGYTFKITRGNKSYRNFLERSSDFTKIGSTFKYSDYESLEASSIIKSIKSCAETGERSFIEQRVELDAPATVHAFVRRVAVNPVNHVAACVLVILGVIRDTDQGISFADIASSLSADYIDLYHVNLETEEYTEYLPNLSGSGLTVGKRGSDFFATARKDAMDHLHKDDADRFAAAFNKGNVIWAMDEYGAFTIGYRLMLADGFIYVSMKALRMSNDPNYMIVGVSNVDAQMRQQEAMERMKEESITYARISALAGNYIGIYTVDPNTERFTQYGAKSGFENLGLDRFGEDFFKNSRKDIVSVIHPDDLEMFEKSFSKEKVMSDVKEHGDFQIDYRLMIEDKPTYVRLKAAMVEEKDGPQLIVGIRNIDDKVRREQQNGPTGS